MSELRLNARRLAPVIGWPLLIFVAVWAYRWLSMGALENDHFVALARAHQILHGDWPIRDFADPGQPLTYLVSAGAAWLLGPTLRSDVIVAITLLSLAASLTFSLAARASGSLLIAAAAVAVEVAAEPRLYNAGKILIPLVAVALAWRYADGPSPARLTALAAWTAIAGLWRHDLLVYVAPSTIAMVAIVHERRHAVRLAAIYLALTLAFLLPWLIYVQWAGGIDEYFAAAVRFAATESRRTVLWPAEGRMAFLATMAIPPLAVALGRRANERLSHPHVVFAASMAIVANVVLLRDVIATRLPDVIGLTAVLAAWIAGLTIPARVRLPGAAVALVIVVALIGERLAAQGYGVPTPLQVVQRFADVSTMLQQETPKGMPNRQRLPLIRYLASCTPAASRVLVSGFGPEIPVLARRAFAGGLPSWIPGYHTHPRDLDRAASRLAGESVSIAVMLEGSDVFVDEWPPLAADLRARGFVERTWHLDGSDVVVWIPEELAARAPSAPPPC
jgi:hypothetical protein